MVKLGMGNKILRQILLKNVAIRWQSSLKVQKSLYLPLAPLFVERPSYFRGNEEICSGHGTVFDLSLDTLADLELVPVDESGVEVPIAALDCTFEWLV